MKYFRNTILEDELIHELNEEMDDPNRGLGVTSYIYCLTKLYYQNYYKNLPRTKEQTLLFSTGLMIEKVFLIGRQQADEGEIEGVGYHLDHWNPDTSELLEFKSTRVSSKKEPNELEDTGGWMKQIKAYCYIKKVAKCQLVILHMMGNYGPPFPQLVAWDLEFEPKEIEENWAEIQARKTIYEDYVKEQETPPPFTFNEDYECKYCEFKVICDARASGLPTL